MNFREQKILVFGVGRSGLAAARALSRHGARVALTDKRPLEELGAYASEAKAAGFELALGGHPQELLDGCALIVLSPGVPGEIPVLGEARKRKIVIWSGIGL